MDITVITELCVTIDGGHVHSVVVSQPCDGRRTLTGELRSLNFGTALLPVGNVSGLAAL